MNQWTWLVGAFVGILSVAFDDILYEQRAS